MSEMRERVARAIGEVLSRDSTGECLLIATDAQCAEIARAAIEAMCEPTEAMMAAVDCGGEKADWLAGKAWKAGWRAMIDEAMK